MLCGVAQLLELALTFKGDWDAGLLIFAVNVDIDGSV